MKRILYAAFVILLMAAVCAASILPVFAEAVVPTAENGGDGTPDGITVGVGYTPTDTPVGADLSKYHMEDTPDDAIAIESGDDFADMAADGVYYLADDITVSATYEGTFTGKIYGENHTITTSVPLFAQLDGATLRDITIAEGSITTAGYAAAVAIEAIAPKLYNVVNYADVESTATDADMGLAGGLIALVGSTEGVADDFVGSAGKTVFSFCVNYGDVTTASVSEAGGLAGAVLGNTVTSEFLAEHCINEGAVSGQSLTGGLFGMVGENAPAATPDYVRNFATVTMQNLTNAGTVTSALEVGGITARLASVNADVENCLNTGDVTSSGSRAAGVATLVYVFAGYSAHHRSWFTNCRNEGDITGKGAAGISGYNLTNSRFTDCVNTGTISSTAQAAGICEQTANWTNGCTYTNCLNDGEVKTTAGTSSIGGILGYTTNPATMINCTNSGAITHVGNANAGGLLGEGGNDNADFYTFTNCLNTGAVTTGETGRAGGMMARFTAGKFTATDCVNTGDIGSTTLNAADNGRGGILGHANDKHTTEANRYVVSVTITSCYNSGDVTGGTPGGMVGYMAAARTDVETPVVITDCTNVGDIKGDDAGGIIGGAGTWHGTLEITGCYNSGKCWGTNRPGGMVGCGYPKLGATLTDCVNDGEIHTTSNYAGGIAGRLDTEPEKTTTYKNCINNGKVTGYNQYAGGMVGYDGKAGQTIFEGCLNTGEITLENSNDGNALHGAAGIAAAITGSSTFTDCVNTGAITGPQNVAGILGKTNSATAVLTFTRCANIGNLTQTENKKAVGVGGILATSPAVSATFTECLNAGNIFVNTMGKELYVGGIAGWIGNNTKDSNGVGTFTSCINLGNIVASVAAIEAGTATVPDAHALWAGGIAANVENKTTATNCVNLGDVAGNQCAGGIVASAGRMDQVGVHKFTGCVVTGHVYSSGTKINGSTCSMAGVAGYGYSTTTVVNCAVLGDVTLADNATTNLVPVGAMIGYSNVHNANVTNSYFTGTLSTGATANVVLVFGNWTKNAPSTTYAGNYSVTEYVVALTGSSAETEFGGKTGALTAAEVADGTLLGKLNTAAGEGTYVAYTDAAGNTYPVAADAVAVLNRATDATSLIAAQSFVNVADGEGNVLPLPVGAFRAYNRVRDFAIKVDVNDYTALTADEISAVKAELRAKYPVISVTAENAAELGATAITSAEEFAAMTANGIYYLANDITISETYAGTFGGTLYGNGNTINTTVPIFNTLHNATVRDLTVAGTVAPAEGNAAALALVASGSVTVIGVINNAAVTAAGSYAGMIAEGKALTSICLLGCENNGAIQSVGNDAGGLIGYIGTSAGAAILVDGYVNTGAITGKRTSGGVVGYIANDTQMIYTDVLNTGTIKAQWAGGIGGAFNTAGADTRISHAINQGTVTGTNYGGGLVGEQKNTFFVTDCANYANVTDNTRGGGLVGAYSGGSEALIENFLNTGKITVSGGSSGAGGVAGVAIAHSLTMKNCVNTGAVAHNNANDAAGIVGELGLNNDAYKTAVYTFINCHNSGDVTGTTRSGGIVGQMMAASTLTFTDCSNSGTITGNQTGGITGRAVSNLTNNISAEVSTYTNCINTGKINGLNTENAGGIVGNSGTATFTNCYNSATVTGLSVGGIAGRIYGAGTFSNCINTGDVISTQAETGRSTQSAGGIVGRVHGASSKCTVTGCVVTGNVYTDNTDDDVGSATGGIVGYVNNNIAINYCAVTGDITVNYRYKLGTVWNNAFGAGAMCGYANSNGGTAKNSYFTGALTVTTAEGVPALVYFGNWVRGNTVNAASNFSGNYSIQSMPLAYGAAKVNGDAFDATISYGEVSLTTAEAVADGTLRATLTAGEFVQVTDCNGNSFPIDHSALLSFKLNAQHSYDSFYCSDDYHWAACACGELLEQTKAEHVYRTFSDETAHWELCAYCEHTVANVDAEEHSFEQMHSESSHWLQCSNENCTYVDPSSVGAHDFGEYESDENYHWKTCACGYEQAGSKAFHSMTLVSDENGHWYACEDCGMEMSEPVEHDLVYGYDEEGHWYECADCDYSAKAQKTAHIEAFCEFLTNEAHLSVCECGYEVEEAHTFGETAYYNSSYHVAACRCGAEDESTKGVHQYSIYAFDGSYHWKECSCGDMLESSYEQHSFDTSKYESDGDAHWYACSVCGAADESNRVAHTFVTRTSTTEHWLECEDCHYINEDSREAHNFTLRTTGTHHWYECDCAQGVSVIASGSYAEHNFVLNHNATEHWYECTCAEGTVIEKENSRVAHSGGEANCLSGKLCEICDTEYTARDPENHVGEATWNQTETQHTKAYYDCCQVVVVETEDHEWNAEGVCSECEYVCVLHDAETPDVDYVKNEGADTHNKICTTCGKILEADMACSGGDATCNTLAECEVCGSAYGELDETDHDATCDDFTFDTDEESGEDIVDETTHTGTYECGLHVVAEAHSWGTDELANTCTVCGYVCENHDWATTPNADGTHTKECNYCDTVVTEAHDEDITWQSDAEGHWGSYDCCGAEIEKAAHNWGEVSDGSCTICDYECAEHAFVWTQNEGNEGNETHVKQCSKCNYIDTEDTVCGSTTSLPTCTDRAICDGCGQAFGEEDPDNHASENIICLPKTEGENIATMHTKVHECCRVAIAEGADEAHTWGEVSDGICDDCGYTCVHAWGSYTVAEGDVHTKTCSLCGKVEEEACSSTGENVATCTDLATCDLCGDTHGELNADNHASTEFYYALNTEDGAHKHDKKHSCCDVVAETEDHTVRTAADCLNAAVCDVCELSFGDVDITNHTEGCVFVPNVTIGDVTLGGSAQEDPDNHNGSYSLCHTPAVGPHIWEEGECTVCEYTCKHAEIDTYWSWTNTGDGTHEKACSKCGTVDSTDTACSSTGNNVADCMNKAVCDKCEVDYGEVDLNNHITPDSFSYVSKDESEHTKKYACCGTVIGDESHDFENGICSECDYACLHDEIDTYWSWTNTGDGTHEKACSKCGTVDSTDTACSSTGENVATCTEQAKCDKCGERYGQLDPNNHSGEEQWVNTETTHKKVWSCHTDVVIVAEENHEWKQDGSGECAECGYSDCSHANGFTYAPIAGNATQHNKTCNTCGEVIAEDHTVAITYPATATPAATHKGVYTCCGAETAEESHAWGEPNDGVCDICTYTCTHDWTGADGICDNCGMTCAHDWTGADGVCDTCGKLCEHDWTGADGVCDTCGYACEHEYAYTNVTPATSTTPGVHEKKCTICDHVDTTDTACTTTGTATCLTPAKCDNCLTDCAFADHATNRDENCIFTATATDENGHTGSYSCGATVENEAHSWNDGVCVECEYACEHAEYSYTDNEDGTHTKSCVACDFEVTDEACEYLPTAIEGNDVKHELKCVCGAKSDEADHTMEGGVCTECEHECTHATCNFTYTDNDDGTHTKTYACGAAEQPEDHNVIQGECEHCDYICDHTDCTATPVNNGNGTHTVTYTCGGTVTEDHEVVEGECTVCDYVCDHTACGDVTYTDNGNGTHTAIYACGGTGETADHTVENGVCTLCDYVCDHSECGDATYSETEGDTHTATYPCGGVVTEAHDFKPVAIPGDAGAASTQHQYVCACGKVQEDSTEDHAYTVKKADTTHHWNECICGEEEADSRVEHTAEPTWTKTATTHKYAYPESCCGVVLVEEEAHEWENGVCTECEYVCDHSACGEVTYVDNGNGTHTKTYACGATEQPEAHSGGSATCKDKAVCAHCNEPYGDVSNIHTYDNDCDGTCNLCNATRTPAAHVWGDWSETKAATTTEKGEKKRTCSVCGVSETEEIAILADDDADSAGDEDDADATEEDKTTMIVIIVVASVVGVGAIVAVSVVVVKKNKAKKAAAQQPAWRTKEIKKKKWKKKK